MKKLLILPLLLIVGFLSTSSAEALSYVQQTTLSFDSITQTEATVRVNIGYDEYRNIAQNRYPIKVFYTNCVGGPTVLCATPLQQTFPYAGTNIDVLSLRLSNLQAGTRYNVYLGYEMPVVCVTAPCNPIQHQSQQQYSFTTSSVTVLPSATRLTFSDVTSTSARVNLIPGTDDVQTAIARGDNIQLSYRSLDGSSAGGQNFNTWNVASPYLTLTDLRPNTSYNVQIGYQTSIACIAIYPSQCATPPTTWIGTWTLTTAPGGTNYPKDYLTEKMYRGVRSSEVVILQMILIKSGFLSGAADGSFGPKTQAAVISFQRSRGLVADGIVGAQTRAMLNAYLAQ